MILSRSYVIFVGPSPGERNATNATIPSGWQQCDGSLITEGPFTGLFTPDLNGERYFLRGGDESAVTTKENDMVHDHTHDVDDPGHRHSTGSDGGKTSDLPVALDDKNLDTRAGNRPGCFETQGSGCTKWQFHTASDHSHTVNSANSGVSVGSVSSSYNKGSETRPKNMAVIYIMRIF